jgi:hypothetical protein
MHISFNLFRIKGLYMFRALLAYPQEALNKRHSNRGSANWQHERNIPSAACVAPTEDEQVTLETCKGKGKVIPLQPYGAQRDLGD